MGWQDFAGSYPSMKPFKYRNRAVRKPDYQGQSGVLRGAAEHEQFVGEIQGEKASDIEERLQRAMDKLELGYQFRVRVTSQALGDQKLTRTFANISGEAEIDFLVEARGQTIPIMVDGQIGHFFTPYQADEDRQKNIVVDEFGKQYGWRPTVRIPFWQLIDQNYADRTARDLFV